MSNFNVTPIKAQEVKIKSEEMKLRDDFKVKALPPWAKEAVEKKAIMENPKLVELLGNARILEIRKVEGGYLVITDSKEMKVDVNYKPSEICGPAQFDLEFHEPTSIK